MQENSVLRYVGRVSRSRRSLAGMMDAGGEGTVQVHQFEEVVPSEHEAYTEALKQIAARKAGAKG